MPYISDGTFKRVGYATMVASGLLLLGQSSREILHDRKPSVRLVSISDGFETEVTWADKVGVLEVEPSGKLSFERVVDIKKLDPEIILQIKPLILSADRVVVEEVFEWKKHYFEIYVSKDGFQKKFEVKI